MATKPKAVLPPKFAKALIVISWVIISAFFIERVTTYASHDVVDATITDCNSKWTEGSTGTGVNTSSRPQVVHYPVATSETGIKAFGRVFIPEELCENLIGKPVKIVVAGKFASENSIYSFIQYWAIGLVFLLIPILFLVSRKSIYLPGTTLIGYGFVIFILVLIDLSNEKKNEQLGINENMTPSEKAFAKCIYTVMREKNFKDRSEITRLICQDETITELSAIHDLLNLEQLYIQGASLMTLESLEPLTSLKVLSIGGVKTLSSTKGIGALTKLEELQANSANLYNLVEVEQLVNLKIIALESNKITDIKALTHLSKLESVALNYNNIGSIKPLSNKPELKRLRLHKNNFSSIEWLYDNRTLEFVDVSKGRFQSCKQIKELRSRLSSDAVVRGTEACD